MQSSSASMSKIAIVTGANTGVGKETVRGLAQSGNFKLIVLACRSGDKAIKAIQGAVFESASER